ncbi:MAG: DEAD/DEAH box helicase [Bacteroidia bacterium]
MELQTILANLGIETLNPMQEQALEMAKMTNEMKLLAPTGSGKTLAFLMMILSKLNKDEKRVQALILTPSRELAIQIETVWRKMATGFKVNVCYGRHDMAIEVQNLSVPPALLIGTPGRIADHLDRQTFDTEGINLLVLDEFDKSLALGFHDQMSFIVENLPHLKTKILVSATSDIEIPTFVGIHHPKNLDFTQVEKPAGRLTFHYVLSENKDKIERLFHLLCYIGNESTIIFCNHREVTERISGLLEGMGIENAFFHGGMEQIDREKTLIRFRNGSIQFLVASDLAARGLDILEIKNIIHYHLPVKSEDFVHRNGRTARVQAEGDVYILLHSSEKMPDYLPDLPKPMKLREKSPLPNPSEWITLYISGGKKDKLGKGDILGFLAKVGNLTSAEIGLITQLDFMSFVAIKREKRADCLPLLQAAKMKGKKYKIEVIKSTSL